MVNLNSLNPFAATISATSVITDLRIYPIKSCRGISVKSTTLTSQGLDLDRRWMFVDPAKGNVFQTIRENAKLTLIDTAFAASERPGPDDSAEAQDLVISIRNEPSKVVRVPARPTAAWLEENTTLGEVEIWGENTDGHLCGNHINDIFSEFVGKPVALVYKGPMARLAGGAGAPDRLGRVQSVNFPDVMPVQVANEASLAELNSRLKQKGIDEITIERFRPNIVVRGGEADSMAAWSEDDWKTVRVVTGEAQPGTLFSSGPSTIELDVGMRCARCRVPNVHPDTAEKHPKEPWDTLVSYRRIDPGIKFKPCFGMLCSPRSEGPIKVGMKLEVTERTTEHSYG